MTNPRTYHWPSVASNVATIASLQTVAANAQVVINSNLPYAQTVPVSNSGIYLYTDMLRTVSFTSTANISGVTFTINGLSTAVDGNGNPTGQLVNTTETRTGPNANTVQTTRLYSQINSITTGNPGTGANTVSVGFGYNGITSYMVLNTNSHSPQQWTALAQPLNAAATFDWTIFASVTRNIVYPISPSDPVFATAPLPPLFPIQIGTGNNTGSSFPQTEVMSMLWATIGTTNAGVNGNSEFYFTVLQQGIR